MVYGLVLLPFLVHLYYAGPTGHHQLPLHLPSLQPALTLEMKWMKQQLCRKWPRIRGSERGWRRQGSMGNILRCFTGGQQPWWRSLSSLSSNLRAQHRATGGRLGLSASFPAWPSPARSPWRHRLPGSGPAQLRIHIHGNICTVIISLPSLISLCL